MESVTPVFLFFKGKEYTCYGFRVCEANPVNELCSSLLQRIHPQRIPSLRSKSRKRALLVLCNLPMII